MRIIDNKALDQFRGPGICGVCNKHVFRLEPHHVICRGHGGGSRIDHPFAVLGLCGTMTGGDDCHYKVTVAQLTIRGRKATQSDLFDLIAKRDGLPARYLEDAVRWFCHASPKMTETHVDQVLARMRPGVAKLVRVLLEAASLNTN